jgi:uncharacterized membrane protein
MNWAHAHLILNHVPVLGTLFGLALLAWAMMRRDNAVHRAALGALVAVALLALPAYFTGEPAEELAERTAGVAKSAIESHEAAAVIALVGVEVLGLLALAGLYRARRGATPSVALGRAVLVAAVITGGLMAWTANLGGQIQHAEIRSGAPAAVLGEADEADEH